MYAISVNKNVKVNQVSSRTHFVRADSNLVDFFIGDYQMKRIPLTQGRFAIVDDEDYEWLNQRKWQTQFNHCGIPYATSQGVRMHRLLMGLKKGDGKIIDHRNRNSLDNRKSNLRICTNQQNCMNSKPRKGSSEYKGVTRPKDSKNWQAQMILNGKHIRLGSYVNEIDAAKAYDVAVINLYGDYAFQNFPEACNG